MHKSLPLIIVIALIISFAAGYYICIKPELNQTYKVGVTVGPHSDIMYVVKNVAKDNGLDIELVVYSDYTELNRDLQQGKIIANSFQPNYHLRSVAKDRNYNIVAVSDTIIFPMGFYSKKIKSLTELKSGAVVYIPNDPVNLSRALILLQNKGLIKLNSARTNNIAINDIVKNPKNLYFIQHDAQQIAKKLAEADLAVLNSNYAKMAGLNPKKDALIAEDALSSTRHVIAVRDDNKYSPAVEKLIKSYHSDYIKHYIIDTYDGFVIPAW